MASTLKDRARSDHHTRCKHITIHDASRLDFYPIRGANCSLELAANHNDSSFQLAVNFGLLAKDQDAVRRQATRDCGIHPKCSGREKVSAEPNSLFQESGPVFTLARTPL
ncbi:MAG: hypothetical protein WA766_16610 [Candidatus Acidiferrales bacterium]|jgi:hypothetical protein